ncbi:hypothetical protein ISS05_03850 [Candidatus Woesearchaeota archaeon]|nr:hypothetical protein [Candidatus Woesearchaeota archaeon]
MARILYGIAGEGMGHAIRSKVVIEHLLKKHELIIVSSRKAYEFLSSHFSNVYDIHGMHLNYKNNKVQSIKTLIHNAYKLPKGSYHTLKRLISILKKFKPDIVISDFEPFTALTSKFFNIPLISIDNMHIMTNCRLKIPKRYYKDYLAAKLIIKSIIIKADYYLINTFCYPKIKKKNTFLFSPVLRKEIINAKVKNKDFILVYQTSGSNKKIKDVLNKINGKFIIYGFDENKKEKNITFKEFDEAGFIEDLASCRALITNGGFSTIVEAVYLGKPVLSEPIRNHFEQILNAIFVEKMGYGEFHKKIKVDKINGFISNIGIYKKNLKGYKKEGNPGILEKLDYMIGKLNL